MEFLICFISSKYCDNALGLFNSCTEDFDCGYIGHVHYLL